MTSIKAKTMRAVWLSGSAIVLTATASPTLGQAGGTAGDERDPNEIIVTAQKREESLQDVPVAIVALTNEKLENLQVRSFVDYMAYLPSASFTNGSTGTPGNRSVSFRGIVTSGGLIGKVTKVIDDDQLEIELADGVKVRQVRAMVSDVRAKGEPVKGEPAKTES